MPKSTTMTVRLTPKVSGKLAKLAKNLKQSKSLLAGEVIASYVEHNARQVAEIESALEEVRSGAAGVPHEKVEKWVRSWGHARELKRPHPKT